jgi:hypothetical protein
LISNFLPDFDWHPIVLTVKPEFYEEKPDPDIIKTVSETTEVVYVNARKVKKPRIIGDIGLRAFKFLKRKALELIKEREIDFIWIPIPSFYTAVLGRVLHNKTGIAYGIDYIDPWIYDLTNNRNLRSLLSNLSARILEPYAVKKASLISGVSTAYYQPVIDRNFKHRSVVHVGMPYGFDQRDHGIKLDGLSFPWDAYPGCKPIVYAGAFLPLSGYFVDLLFKSIAKLKQNGKIGADYKLFFLGTGSYSHKSFESYAEDYDISEMVIEIRDRFPFLKILNFLSKAHGVMIIGSTEKHYTASKTFQSLLSERPVFTIFHNESSALRVMKDCEADDYSVSYHSSLSEKELILQIEETFLRFIKPENPWSPNLNALEKYSAKRSAESLVKKMNLITEKN